MAPPPPSTEKKKKKPNVLRFILSRIGVGRGGGGNGGNGIDTGTSRQRRPRSRDTRSRQQQASSERRLQQQRSASYPSSSLATFHATDRYHCDYASIDHAISTKSNEWHAASCVYITILSTLGILLVVSIFWGAKRSSAAAATTRGRKSNGNGGYHRSSGNKHKRRGVRVDTRGVTKKNDQYRGNKVPRKDPVTTCRRYQE